MKMNIKKILATILAGGVILGSLLTTSAEGQSTNHDDTYLGYIENREEELGIVNLPNPSFDLMRGMTYYYDYVLTKYPNASYYNTNNGKSCTCHTLKCTYEVPNTADQSHCWIPSQGKSGTCIRYENSIQCAAFAKYVFSSIKDYSYANGSTTNYNTFLTGATAKQTLQNVGSGTYLRVNTKSTLAESGKHSVAIVLSSPSQVTIHHANYDAGCKVRYQTISWEDFAKMFPYLYYVVK